MARALVLLAEGAEEMETVITVDVLRRGGIDVTLASLDSPAPVLCSRGIRLLPDKSLTDIPPADVYDAIVLPGGLGGAKALAASKDVGARLKAHESAGKIVAAICAAPSALAAHGIASKARMTSHPCVADQMKSAGYEYIESERVVCDRSDTIVTSRGPGTAMEFAVKLVELLAGAEKVKEITPGMILNF